MSNKRRKKKEKSKIGKGNSEKIRVHKSYLVFSFLFFLFVLTELLTVKKWIKLTK